MAAAIKKRAALYIEVADQLRDRILKGDLRGADRLPPEAELAAALQVSRGTVREALRALEKEGLVVRRHGLGSFIRRPSGGIVSSLDYLQPFSEVIRQAGFTPSMEVLGCRQVVPPAPAKEQLDAAALHRPVYEVETRHFANDTPVIYGSVWVPVDDEARFLSALRAHAQESMLDLFRREMGYDANLALLSLEAVSAAGHVAARLGVRDGTALLKLTGPTYDEADRALWYTEAYVRTDLMRFVIARR